MLGLGLEIQKIRQKVFIILKEWILSAGFWDDSKNWIDTENWND